MCWHPALIWPLAADAQSTTQPTQGTAANSPRIEMVRVKLIDQSAPEPRFQLRDGVIDLRVVSASAALTGLVPPGKCLPQLRRSTRATGDGETGFFRCASVVVKVRLCRMRVMMLLNSALFDIETQFECAGCIDSREPLATGHLRSL